MVQKMEEDTGKGFEGRYLAFSGVGDESAKGREEKSGKVAVLLKSGRGDMVTKLSQCGENFLSCENLLRAY